MPWDECLSTSRASVAVDAGKDEVSDRTLTAYICQTLKARKRLTVELRPGSTSHRQIGLRWRRNSRFMTDNRRLISAAAINTGVTCLAEDVGSPAFPQFHNGRKNL